MKYFNTRNFTRISIGVFAGLVMAQNSIASEKVLPNGYNHLDSAYYKSTSVDPATSDQGMMNQVGALDLLPASLEHLRSTYFNEDNMHNSSSDRAITIKDDMNILPDSYEYLESAYYMES